MTIPKRLQAVLDILLLVALFWVVRYWHSRHFGLYEDDLTIIPDAFQRSFSSLMSYIFIYITHFYGHARPLSDSFIYFFSWIGWHIAGLWGPYLLGYLITAMNIGLFYGLMLRTAGRSFALIAGFGYILYSADTTQAFLTHSLGVQPSVLLILLAMHAYLSNKRILAYLLAFVVLFSYELPFLLLAAAPLLKKPWGKTLWKEILWHTGILVGMLAAIYFFRTAIGEGRVSGLSLKDLVTTPFVHSLEGPFVSLGSFAFRPLQAIQDLNLEVAIAVLLAFGLFLWILSRLEVPTQVKLRTLWHAVRDPTVRGALPEQVRALGRVLVAGVVMLVLAYPLTFTVRAYAITGRDTRVHLAGAAGAAVLVAAVAFFLIYLTNGSRWRRFINILIAMELALLAGYGFVIQRDYVLAWNYQRQFWTELLPLISDAGPDTAILIEPSGLADTSQIGANTWNLQRVLDQLYIYPGATGQTPQIYRLTPGWQDILVRPDGGFRVNILDALVSSPVSHPDYDHYQILFITTAAGQFSRLEQMVFQGRLFKLKPVTQPVLSGLPHGFLYPLMILQH